jgi:hypothetical protein
VHSPKLPELVKTSLDELRMQMLGSQILFGFQLQSVFQDGFSRAPLAARRMDALALGLMVLAIGLLLAAPAQHRLVERGNDSLRLFRLSRQLAECALAPLAAALACDVFIASAGYWGIGGAASAGIAAGVIAIALWYGSGRILPAFIAERETVMPQPQATKTDLHAKIGQMLTEARVILPGAQALLGFQFVVTLTKPFSILPNSSKDVHLAALFAVVFAVVLLIAPAAVHRLTYKGEDAESFHRIGSVLVTIALIPLALGMAGDFYVASSQMLGDNRWAATGAAATFFWLATLWYGVPLYLRAKRGA